MRSVAMLSRRALGIFFASIVVPGTLTSFAMAQETADRSASLREQVKAAWVQNHDRLGMVEAQYDSLNLDPRVDKEKTIKHGTPDGAQFIMTMRPKTEHTISVAYLGEKYRYESKELGEKDPRTRLLFDGQHYDQWQSWNKTLAVRRPDQMAGMLPLDPREACMFDIRQPFLSLLPELRLTQQVSPEGELQRIEAEYDGPNRFWIRFDPRVDFLPVESILYHVDGSILWHTKISYQRIESRDAWLVSKVDMRQFAKGDVSKLPTEKIGPTTTLTLTSHELRDPPTDEKLTLLLPTGTRVVDMTDLPKHP